MNACPDCGSTHTRRIPRTMLQRLVLVNSKNILCSHCGERSLVLWPNLFQRAARPERAIIRPPVLARRMMY